MNTRGIRIQYCGEDSDDENSSGDEYLPVVPHKRKRDNASTSPSPKKRRLEVVEIERDWSQWVSASKTRNYMIRDPLLDWFKEFAIEKLSTTKYVSPLKKALAEESRPYSFISYILRQGNVFEDKVMDLLKERFGDNVLKIGGDHRNARSKAKVHETTVAMYRGTPIIHGGVLHNEETKTYGVPDLIVRSDWLNKIMNSPVVTDEEATRSSHFFTKRNYHYVIIDIKFSTLHLRSNGVHLLNSGSMPAYKSQVYIYNEALAQVQKYNPHKAYLLGRRWTMKKNDLSYVGDNCFDKLGLVDFEGIDKDIPEKTRNATNWILDVRQNGRTWNFESLPLPRKEMYPNMCNTLDGGWHHVKKEIAKNIGEITELWMCGTKNREIAHSRGIFSWHDPRCCLETLGVKENSSIGKVVKRMIEINRDHSLPSIVPQTFKGEYSVFSNTHGLVCYIDFETINNVMTNFETLPCVSGKDMVFMIGIGFLSPSSGEWTYRNFTAEGLTHDAEKNMCKDFVKYTNQLEQKYGELLCVHWGRAEQTFWNGVVSRHPEIHNDVNWYDLHKVFRQEPILIRGCLNFGLKSVAKNLHAHGKIKTIWDVDNPCTDGMSAMVEACRVWKVSSETGSMFSENPVIKDIIQYNEVDVKVLQEIVGYLKSNLL